MTTPFHLLLLLACHAIASGFLSSSHSLPQFARNMEELNPDRRAPALINTPPMISDLGVKTLQATYQLSTSYTQ